MIFARNSSRNLFYEKKNSDGVSGAYDSIQPSALGKIVLLSISGLGPDVFALLPPGGGSALRCETSTRGYSDLTLFRVWL
jgi:hypothetical protein